MTKSFANKFDLCIKSKEGLRLDKTLTQIMPEELGLSRSRVQELIIKGYVSDLTGKPFTDPSLKAYFGLKLTVTLPQPDSSYILPEPIKLDIVYEDSHLLVVNKPAGMVVHPAPGAKKGTLVNALLFHCGTSLSGIGGEKRPGIVHRIDKDTSGLIAIAKTDLAHIELAKQFFHHSVERKYLAFIYGSFSKNSKLRQLPGIEFEDDGRIKIARRIGRHKFDRTKMAVHESFGRHAVTRIQMVKNFRVDNQSFASLIECQLETGRTHQIRVHLSWAGHAIIGDQTYKSAKKNKLLSDKSEKEIIEKFDRQALHAWTLGFYHPKTNKWLSFSSKMPMDMLALHQRLDQVNENC